VRPRRLGAPALRQINTGQGRLEIRAHGVRADAAVVAYLAEAVPWPGLSASGRVDAMRHLGEGSVARRQRSYQLSRRLRARACAAAVRTHWQIENRVPWRLDGAFRADESRVRVGPAAANLAVLRRLALHLLKQDTSAKCGVKARRLKAGWSTDYLLHILTG
jgi:predicted transposase YbfD/YdcC